MPAASTTEPADRCGLSPGTVSAHLGAPRRTSAHVGAPRRTSAHVGACATRGWWAPHRAGRFVRYARTTAAEVLTAAAP
ncbi:hypothetical protein [Micromonospora sp. NPDC023814]|uniref:hypothetical protein n=1 Tax=Micromonospora sp. NPDC023814 TaxID=3154596 RepID=UPI0033FF1565